MSNLRREIRFIPAFDKRHTDDSKNYGIHGAEIYFYLIGDEGAVQFVIHTSWHLPHVQAELDRKTLNPRFPYLHHKPMATDIGYHSKIARYEGQTALFEKCEFTNGPCFYDGSTLNAKEPFEVLVSKGHEALWAWMENYYRDTLGA